MSEIVDIMDVDESKYKSLLDDDIIENIDRKFYNGLLCRESSGKKPNGGIIWEEQNSEFKKDTISEIVYFDAPDEDTAAELLKEYTTLVSEDNVKKTCFELKGVDDNLKKFLTDHGFTIEERESRYISITLQEALDSRFMESDKYPGRIVPVSELSLMQFRQWVSYCFANGECGIYDDLDNVPKDWFDEDISCCCVDHNRILGMFLLHRTPSGLLTPVLLFSTGHISRMTVLHMLRFAIKTASKKYPTDTLIRINKYKERTRRIMDALFPENKGDIVLTGVRKE